MGIEFEGGAISLVLRFAIGPHGEATCRVHDVTTGRRWVVHDAAELRRMIYAARVAGARPPPAR